MDFNVFKLAFIQLATFLLTVSSDKDFLQYYQTQIEVDTHKYSSQVQSMLELMFQISKDATGCIFTYTNSKLMMKPDSRFSCL